MTLSEEQSIKSTKNTKKSFLVLANLEDILGHILPKCFKNKNLNVNLECYLVTSP